MEAQDDHGRFFTENKDEENEKKDSRSISLNSEGSDEQTKGCRTLRVIQFLLPCLKKKGVWEASQGDVFKSHDAEEAKYPKILRLLESRFIEFLFILSCVLSIFLFLFSEGFLLESRLLWGIIHFVNAIYAMGLFCQWLQILIKSKYAKNNHGYTTRDIVFTLLSVFPVDLIVLAIYTMNDEDDNDDSTYPNPISKWMITVSRLNYLLRIRFVMQHFSKWEDQLIVGDFRMFFIRTFFYATFLIHMYACIWHRLACESFKVTHLNMTADEATVAVCHKSSWIGQLKMLRQDPLLLHDWNVLITHYLVSVYWTIITTFRLGAGDIKTSLVRQEEVAFVSVAEITAWIFVLSHVLGTLTSLFIEKDTEKENFRTRCFAIRQYLQFGEIIRPIQDEVTKFYTYLWERSSGILNLDLVDVMHHTMRSEVFYDVNKFVLDQLPLLKGLETPFLMSLSVRTNHRFFMSGEILFRRNEPAFAMYYLVKGHLEVMSDDEKHPITTIRSGSAIGEINLLQPYLHVSTVRCGSDCEIRTLSRKHFKQVLNINPQFVPVLEQRLETTLEQSGLLLALCEKHNTYYKAFAALHEQKEYEGGSMEFRKSDVGHSFENITRLMSIGGGLDENKLRLSRVSYDFDGLVLGSEAEEHLHQASFQEQAPTFEKKKGYDEMLAAAFEAVETDVARAGALANDLNIPRPPIIVSAPDASHITLGFKQQAVSENVFVRIFKHMKDPTKGVLYVIWKFLVSLCALFVFWYYPYQFGFADHEGLHHHFNQIDYMAHSFDVIFALDFIYDMIQIVITPRKTFETFKEITIYRMKTFYFYLRIFTFLPIEYISDTINGIHNTSFCYLFKMNRLIEIHLVTQFLRDFEIRYQIHPIIICMVKFALGLFFITHAFAVIYGFVLMHVDHIHVVPYRIAFYRSIVVVTAVGYGDYKSRTNAQVTVEVFALIIGVSVIIYMGSRVTALLVNLERKRVSFKQTFYALDKFMERRKFPRSLVNRVKQYYDLQWRAHQGTLIPTGRSVIWDAPKSVLTKVCIAHAFKYVCRIPLFMYSPIYLQNEVCVALRHYLIPAGEIILHANEVARDLYIISKGYVEVTSEGKRIAIFTEGRFIGLSGLIRGVNTPYMFKTLTSCQILVLTYESLIKMASWNPNFLREMDLLAAEPTPTQSEHTMAYELPSYPSREFLDRLERVDITDRDAEQLIAEGTTKFWYRVKPHITKFYLLPNGIVLKWWMAIRLCFAIASAIYALIQVVLPIQPELAKTVFVYLDVVAWIDIIISLRIAYYGEKNQLITNSRKMAFHYLSGPFLIDFLGSFPFDAIIYHQLKSDSINYHNYYHIVRLLRLNRLLQCYKLLLTNCLLEKTMFKSLTLLMLLEMAPIMFLFINLMACISILYVCGISHTARPVYCKPNSWISKAIRRLNHDNITESYYDLRDTFRSYSIALYWVTQSAMGVGYGDVEVGTNYDNQSVAVMVIFLGVMVVSFAGGKLTSCMAGEDPAKTMLQEKMAMLRNFLLQQRTSRSIRRRVKEVYINAWNNTSGVSPKTLFLTLPPTLKADVMKQLYGATLKSSPLFANLDEVGLRMLAGSLQEIFYPEGEFLMKFGDLCSDVFFIAHGAVVCYNVRGVIMSQLGGGSIIGEIATFFHTHRLYTTIAVTDVNAYVIERDIFMNFLKQYPEIKTQLENYSIKHYREAMTGSRRADSIDYDVLLSYQNETDTTPGPSSKRGTQKLFTINTDSTAEQRQSMADALRKSLAVDSKDSEADLTRNKLTEDVLKGPEELSKVSTDKWWSVFITFGRMARDEMGFIHICQEPQQCNITNFTIHPVSAACNMVSLYLIITAISCGITAFEIAFFRSHKTSDLLPIVIFRYVLELFFIIRIIGNFHLGYYDETATLITDVHLIARRYARKVDGLIVDIITTIPIYLIADIFDLHHLSEYIRGVQLLRVHLFVRYLSESDFTLRLKASQAKVFKITILLCFIFHFWACAWYLTACYNIQTEGSFHCTRGSWMHKTLHDMDTSQGPHSKNITLLSRYLLSLYFVTNTLTQTGFGDITPRSNIELCLTVTMIFATVFAIGFLIGDMAQCLASQVAAKIHYQHKLTVLENHFTSLGISNEKFMEMRQYFKLLWCRSRGLTLHNLMAELPYSLRADLAMEVYGPNLRSSRILGKLDENLIRQICAQIRHEIYFPGSHIVRSGDVCSCMYFIKKGEVVILDGSSSMEVCVEILYENECFGEVKILLPKETYRFSYVARLESEVGVLHKADLEAVMRNHTRVFEEVKEKANKVKARRQSVKSEDERLGRTSFTSLKSNPVSQHGDRQKK